jgi:hypothetical protein
VAQCQGRADAQAGACMQRHARVHWRVRVVFVPSCPLAPSGA